MRDLRFVKIVDRLTINGENDSNHKLRLNGDSLLIGLVNVIATSFLEAVDGNLHLRTASDKSVLGLTATQLRDELSVFRKAQLHSDMTGTLSPGHDCGSHIRRTRSWRRGSDRKESKTGSTLIRPNASDRSS